MAVPGFVKTKRNNHDCHEKGEFLIVKNNTGTWNAYRNGSSVVKQVISTDIDDKGVPINTLGAKEYATPEEAAIDCA